MKGGRSRKLHAFTAILFLMSCLALPKGAGASSLCPTDNGHYITDGTDEYCIIIIHEAVSWQEANEVCNIYDGLYSPDSVDRSRQLASLIQREENGDGNYWVSVNDLSNPGVYQWLDNSEIAYSNWFHDEPNNANDNENCVHVSASLNYQWNDRACDLPTEFVCQSFPYPLSGNDWGCMEGWGSFKGRCFKVIDTQKMGWEESQEHCQTLSDTANLAAITSHEVHQFITESTDMPLEYGESYWIGLNDRETEGEYRWGDAFAQTAFTYWKSHEPNDADDDEDCVRIQGDSNFRWNDAQCETLSYSICESVYQYI